MPHGQSLVSQQPVAENRLVRVINNATSPATVTTMDYDGMWRRTRVRSTAGPLGQVLNDRRYVWADTSIAEERDVVGIVIKRFFEQGVQVAGGAQFYLKDHLGSVRGLVGDNGLIISEYDFDLWGRRRLIVGAVDADFGFTGHLENSANGVTLAWFRGYDADLGTWMTREKFPLSYDIRNLKFIGPNRPYTHAHNDPLSFWDTDGQFPEKGPNEALKAYSNVAKIAGCSSVHEQIQILEIKVRCSMRDSDYAGAILWGTQLRDSALGNIDLISKCASWGYWP